MRWEEGDDEWPYVALGASHGRHTSTSDTVHAPKSTSYLNNEGPALERRQSSRPEIPPFRGQAAQWHEGAVTAAEMG